MKQIQQSLTYISRHQTRSYTLRCL